ncbi:hypothetical protein K1719_017763 [Acacia pycnantha]|nr:hypothetical protein K1719_017763 [Acacia pycnantha]
MTLDNLNEDTVLELEFQGVKKQFTMLQKKFGGLLPKKQPPKFFLYLCSYISIGRIYDIVRCIILKSSY